MIALYVLAAVVAADQANTSANVIAAIAAVITAVGVPLTAAALLVTALRTKRDLAVNTSTLGKVETIVNQNSTDKDRRIVTLTKQLTDAGLVPLVDQSLPVPGLPDAQPGQPT